jgi:hypothetical protein
MEIKYIEFGDKDDPRSPASPDHDGGIRLSISPEGLVVAFGGQMTKCDQEVLGAMLRLAYQQGKEVACQIGEAEW